MRKKIVSEIDELTKRYKGVTVFAIVDDNREITSVQSGCSPTYLEPLASYIEAVAKKETLGSLFDMLSDEALDQVIRTATKRFFRPTPDTSNVACYKCRNFKEKSNHFGSCEHNESPFDGEESNKQISGCPAGCPFFERLWEK